MRREIPDAEGFWLVERGALNVERLPVWGQGSKSRGRLFPLKDARDGYKS